MNNIKSKISVIVLCKNELGNLKKTNLLQNLKQYTNDLIVIDGHSTDGTLEFAKLHTKNVFLDAGKGKGQAIRQSAEVANNDI